MQAGPTSDSPNPAVIVHLAASPFFGGPERQMLGLGLGLPRCYRSVYLSFAERGLARPFLDKLRDSGMDAIELKNNWPHLRRCVQEVTTLLRELRASVLLCHGYKPDLVGWIAARRVGIPVVAVSRGWTWATPRVRLYEAMDRRVMRRMDRVVCVSECQAWRVRAAKVSPERISIIRNAIDLSRFEKPDHFRREALERIFGGSPERIVCAAGRLSPEKGFEQLVGAAAIICRSRADVGFVLFGDGPLRESLRQQIAVENLESHFVLAGFRGDVDAFLPSADVVVLPSYTEGLPNVALEASAAGVPVVATAVGGTPEVVKDGITGYLVPPRDPATLAARILDAIASEEHRRTLGENGRDKVRREFTFASQAVQYRELFQKLLQHRESSPAPGEAANSRSAYRASQSSFSRQAR